MWNSILVPTDLSENSSRIVGYAHRLAKQLGAKLFVLHVVQYRKVNMNYALAFPSKAAALGIITRNAREDIKAILPDGDGDIKVIIEPGDPLKVILDSVERYNIDLVLMDGSEHSALRHLARGRWQCLISQVAQKAPVPVVLVNSRSCSLPADI